MFPGPAAKPQRRGSIGFPAAVLLLLCTASVAQELKEFDTDYLQSPSGGPALEEAEQGIVRRTNEFRQAEGLSALKTDDRLQKAASYFAAYMARTNEYGHGADGNRPAERVSLFDYDYCIAAENIAWQLKSIGFETTELSRKFFDGWKNSPEHRANMLNGHVTETGVAIGHAPESDRYFAVQIFGRPRSAAIEFQVANRTSEPIRYTVHVEGHGQGDATQRTFDLPPRATMFHTRCRPSHLDWAWTEGDDKRSAEDKRAYVIRESADGPQVSEQPIDDAEQSASPNE